MSAKDQSPSEITQILMDWNDGDQHALDRLMPLIFQTLHQIARNRFYGERQNHTLQPTALVSELYMRFLGEQQTHWQNRAHFFGAVSEMMRRILLDNARKHRAAKRGADKLTRSEQALDGFSDPSNLGSEDLIAIDEALQDLEKMDPQQGRIVQLKYYVGMSVTEIAEIMNIGERTVKREWATAKAWLYQRLN